MKGFVAGADRAQASLLPESLEDWVDESNAVRVIDAFVDALDLADLGFEGVEPEATGRPAYHPSTHLKLYIYGYLYRVQSSRRLEREAGRNVEVMWLLRRLMPDHKTIADFRKDNGKALRKVCARFVELCREMGLLAKASVAIDGSKFKAVNNRDKNFTQAKVERRRKQLEESVSRYLAQLDTADLQDHHPGVEIRITDPETGAVLPQGDIGMIEVRGPNVFRGYWRMPEKTKAEFREDGFFISGDLGYIDPRGYVYISGRGKDLIISGGFNVYPAEVEGAIEALPGVAECAVVGVPHADFGEGVVAVVTAKPGASLDERQMIQALAGELAKYKLPKRIHIAGDLPRNAMGKVQKNLLREQHAATFSTGS